MTDEPITQREKRQRRDAESFSSGAHRMLPQSSEAEQAVLCSILLSPAEVIGLCQERGVKPDWFHVAAHGSIYSTLLCMSLDGEPIDYVTLTQKLHDLGQLELSGGPAFVMDLYAYLPTAVNVEQYLGILEEKHTLREAIRICDAAMTRAYNEQDNVAGLVADLHGAATALCLPGGSKEMTFRQILQQTHDRWAGRKEGKAKQICTGFPRLDLASPIRRKHTVVIAGRRKSGKSALAGSIVLRVAGEAKMPTLVFSLEMPSDEWVDRLISEHGEISQRRIHSGDLAEKDWTKAAEAIAYLDRAPIEIFDSTKMLDQIVAKMRRWKQQHPTGALCVIDYLQLVGVPQERGQNREQEVAKVSRTLFNAGKELDMAVIELCQLNQGGSARESTAIEMDCTAFWQVIEDLDEHGAPVKGREQLRTVLVKFQRHGGMGERIPFTFTGDWMKFAEDEGAAEDDPTLIDVPAEKPRKNWGRREQAY